MTQNVPRGTRIWILVAAIAWASVVAISGCASSRRIMKGCKVVDDPYYVCETP